MSISNTVKSIQDIMRKDAGVDGDAQRIAQLGWMLFVKIFDDREREYELLEDSYKSAIPEELRWRNWAADPEGITGDELLDFVNNKLFRNLKNLTFAPGADPRGFVVREVFTDAYNYMKSGTLMRQVVNKLNDIDFNSSKDRHLFGDIYEKILKDLQSAGNAGEFYTPRAVTQFIVDMVDPKLGETVLDPACGTGGFLTCTIENIRAKYVKTPVDEALLQASINGVEKKALPHLLCTTNMLLHEIEIPSQIRHDNTLARPLRDHGPRDRVDAVVTNPPFGGMEEDGIETNFPKTYRTRETADLFLVLIMHLLKPGGRCGMVLPDGTLFGEGVKTRIKERLLQECNLHTIVRLPNGVFNPYTGIRTNLLFFTKGEPTKEIWYFEHPYPEGYKSYGKTKPIRIEEFDREKAWWNNREENECAWRVSIDDIKASGYNLDIKNPNAPDAGLGDPDKLMKEYKEILDEIARNRNTLKKELTAALGKKSIMDIETFTTNFALLADIPNGIIKLREMILQLAVMGKLVPQDPNDESASVLLKKIAAEKERLIAEGKIKKSKPLPPIDPSETPYELPKGWEWVQMQDISTNVHYGYTASADPSRRDIRLLRITDIQNDKVDWNTVPGCEIDANLMHQYVLSDGDIVVARTGGTIGKSYLVSALNVAAVFASYLIRIIPSRRVNPPYIKLFLGSDLYWNQLYKKSMGTGQPNVNGTSLKSLYVPLPPIAEQKRIVAKVDELMVLCDELEEQKQRRNKVRGSMSAACLHELTSPDSGVSQRGWIRICNHFDLLHDTPDNVAALRQSILQLAVMGKLGPQDPKDESASVLLNKIAAEKERLIAEGKIRKPKPLPPIDPEEVPYELPGTWQWVRLEELATKVTDGEHLSPKKADSGVYLLTAKHVTEQGVSLEDPQFVSATVAQKCRERCDPEIDDILICSRGTIGRCTIVDINEYFCLMGSVILVKPSSHVNSKFLMFFLRTNRAQEWMRGSTGATAVKALYLKDIKKCPIPCPPLAEQKRIVEKLDQLMAICFELESKLQNSYIAGQNLIAAVVNQITST